MDESLLMSLGGSGDPQTQQKALQYFEQLKAAEDGWKLCASYIAQGVSSDEYVKFFCFQVIEDFLKKRYAAASAEDQQLTKNLLLSWIQIQSCGTQDKTYLRNKRAQLFSLAFVIDFPQRWPTFFSDILQVLTLGAEGTDVYQRILMAIDSEVVDREIAHSPQEAERNNKLKDDMRIHAIPQLVDSWYQIITTYVQSHPDLVCRTLEVIGAYIAWIDIGLIANERFVSAFLKFMTNVLLRESACDCICEIIVKGMEPMGKLELIQSFMSVLQSTGVFNVTEDEEGDYLAKLSKLVNAIGLQLIAGWHKLVKSQNPDHAQLVFQELDSKVPLMFTFLSNEDDDVSGAIAKFSHDYITLVKQLNPLPSQQQQHLRSLLIIIIQKMKYDDSYNFEVEGEEEAMFQEYRKELKIIFNNLGAVDGNFLIQTVHELISKTLTNWQSQSFQDVEVSLYLLYSLAETIPGIHGQSFSTENRKIGPLLEMIKLLASSRVSCFAHPSVVLQFFETVVRYDKFFAQETTYIPDVLTAFLDERGLRSKNAHVRSRSAYLFSRFVKSINKGHLQPYLDEILTQVDGLLVLNTPDNGVIQHSLSSNDQLFLYETAGVLIVQSSVPPERKLEYMKQLLAPIVSKFNDLLKAMVQCTNEQQQLAYAQCISQAMAFASRTSKGFSSQMTMKNNGCVEVYTNILSIFLAALNVPVHRQLLHSAVRQFLHRMIVTLDTEVLPFIPVTMEHLLKNADAKELHDFIPLINQVVAKFKDHVVPFLQQVFMPIVTSIFQVLSTPADEQDQVAITESRMLRRSYFSFIAALLNNNVSLVLSNQESQNLHQVLLTVIQGGVEIADPQAQKVCFAILKKLVELWAGKAGLAGFDEFVYKSILPACFMAPMKPSFDLTDAQTVLVLNECAGCLKVIHDKKGNEALQYLQTTYLPSLNVSPELIQQFCIALKSDNKTFRNYFKTFFIQGKS